MVYEATALLLCAYVTLAANARTTSDVDTVSEQGLEHDGDDVLGNDPFVV